MNSSKRLRPILIGLLLATAFGMAQGAAAEAPTYNADPAQIATFLTWKGIPEYIVTDPAGDPMIVSRQSVKPRHSFNIYFYRCENNKNCGSIMYRMNFRVKSAKVTPAELADVVAIWNANNRFGRAYLDSNGNPVVEMDVNMWKGMSAELFESNFDLWTSMTNRFAVEIGPSEDVEPDEVSLPPPSRR